MRIFFLRMKTAGDQCEVGPLVFQFGRKQVLRNLPETPYRVATPTSRLSDDTRR